MSDKAPAKKKNDDDLVMRFSATVEGVKTTTDGGIRITLDIDESKTNIAKQFMDARRLNQTVKIAAIFIGE